MPVEHVRTRLSHVMVGVDGGPAGCDAVALGRDLLAAGGRLTLAHVEDPLLVHGVHPGYDSGWPASTVAPLEAEIHAAGPGVELVTARAPSAGEGLHRLAEEQEVDVLVVGSCRHGRVGRAMLGDDTRAALDGAECAVAIAPSGYADLKRDMSSIGVAYDGSPESREALEVARELAARTGAAILVCEVVGLPSYAYSSAYAVGGESNIETVVALAQERLDSLEGVEGQAVYGVTGEELAAFGRHVDLLICGSRGYGPARRLITGSTSRYLTRHSRCALLVVPRSARRPDRTEPAEPQSFPRLVEAGTAVR